MLSPLVGYAATALGHIAITGGGPLQVREIALATGVPAPYLSKIVHQLARKSFVATRRGTGGGVQLAIDPNAVTLLDLCEAFDDPILRPQCMLGLGPCDDDVACPAHEVQSETRARQLDFLRATTLLDVGHYYARKRPRGVSAPATPSRSTAAARARPAAALARKRKGGGG